jgi:hypothetical protein
MRVLKESRRPNPRVSVVLLDWSVRESFHLLQYLAEQRVARETFEVLVIECYSRQSPALRPRLATVDTWALLDLPERCCHHKHLMYNAGIVLARGEIVVFCDSDAMVRETFIGEIVRAFDEDPNIVLHLDQFRNARRDLYPFRSPSFDEVMGPGCVNNHHGRTRGVAAPVDPLHERNYGACMCARRDALVDIGGADEHVDFLGHICGPYDMTFRLANDGYREVWHETEFLYHTWHPGQAGADNYLGPHDGRHMSTTALDALATGRVLPLVGNPAVAHLRDGEDPRRAARRLVRGAYRHMWRADQWPRGVPVAARVPDRAAAPRATDRSAGGWAGRLTRSVSTGLWLWWASAALAGGLRAAFVRPRRSSGPASSPLPLPQSGALLAPLREARRGTSLVGTGRWVLWQMARAASPRGRRLVAWHGRRVLARVWSIAPNAIDRVRRFGMESRLRSAMLSSIVVRLRRLRRANGADAPRPITVVVDVPGFALCLTALIRARLLPPCRLVAVANASAARAAFADLRPRLSTGTTVVGWLCYAKYHGLLRGVGAESQLLVV